jgi:tRNA1(Val) A37 N6-methylase TrmN6
MQVFAKSDKPGYRCIFQFKQQKNEGILEEILVIRNQNNTYTDKYQELTRDFYLDF